MLVKLPYLSAGNERSVLLISSVMERIILITASHTCNSCNVAGNAMHILSLNKHPSRTAWRRDTWPQKKAMIPLQQARDSASGMAGRKP